MPCISENIICVTVPELERCGVLKASIWTGLKRHRQGLVNCWEHHKIGNTIYIHYDNLKEKYKALIQKELCDGLEVSEWLKYNIIRDYLSPVIQQEKTDLNAYMITRERTDVSTGEIRDENRTKLAENYINLVLYQSRWLRAMHKEVYEYRKPELRTLGIRSINEYRNICRMLANSHTTEFPEGAKLPSNAVACYRKQQEYERNGILSLVTRYFGNTTAQKVDDERLQVLIDLYSDPHKPDFRRVTGWYNRIVLENGWIMKNGKPATITEGCVKQNLKIPEVMQVWYLARHGLEAWKNMFGYTILRYRPSMRDAVWCGDGTKVNLYYTTPAGTAARLNVYAIVDAHSGYWLGWDISEESDNMKAVQRAFRMAVIRSGYRMPFQMQYDNDSSNNYFNRLTCLHFPAMPNNGQSKIIERCFKNLQEQHMKYADGFTGMNITAGSINNQVNKDYFEYLKKNKKLKNKQETILLQEKFLHLVNNTPDKDGKTPKEKYFGSENPGTDTLTNYDWVNLFWEWNETPCTYAKEGLIWIEDKEKKIYEVAEGYEFDYQNDVVPERYTPDSDFPCRWIRQKFWVRFDPRNRKRIALYKEEADKSRRFVAWAVEKDRMAYAVQDYKEGERKEIDKRLQLKKEQQARAREKRKAAAELMDSEEKLKLGYQFYDKEILAAAEAEMYEETEEVIPTATVSNKRQKSDRKEYLRKRRDSMSKELNQ